MKDNIYLKVRIEICRHCGGRGVIGVVPEGVSESDVDTMEESSCPVCKGGGRVKVRREIHVSVDAYDGLPMKGIVEFP